MEPIGSSLIPLPKSVVYAACADVICRIHSHREKKDQEYLQRHVDGRNKPRWWNKLFKIERRQITLEEAREEILAEIREREFPNWSVHIYFYPCHHFEDNLDCAERLLSTMEHCTSDTVYISPHDWELIK